ncbi:MAG TPA: adenylate/guanylate cyclase domain-containing protein [Candidatus Limnocylindria bacterium]|nr:adenylate/guanylate cyclase domain-containing protein [Candidatus Limnocylindria bacterium]
MADAGVSCAQCGQANPATVKFCGHCGARLEIVCGACHVANPPANKFCHECGASLAAPAPDVSPRRYTPKHLADKILTSRSALEGERKQVTVLFVDVSGFTSLSERLDPEDVHRLMTRAFELMLAEVHRYEGTVNQFLGDGIMALFGAPIAHEDHARRAVHAALGIRAALETYQEELQRRRGIAFQVRQGLNTGLVVVGSIGNDLRMDYTAVGDTTNVAARLLHVADRGRLVVSDATHRLIEGFFYTRPLGELALKGKAEPVAGWEVISARQTRTRLEVGAERGLTPYVGREREMQALFEAFERTRAGHGQVVFVVGEPGIGKSRLLYEFRRRLADDATWLEGHCISFGQSIALHPVVDMLKRTFRIEEGDGEDTIATKIERSVTLLGEDLRAIVPYLRYVLSVDPGDPTVLTMDAQERRGETFGALRRLLARAAEIRPQILVYEDIHWMDKTTEEALLATADSIPTNRILQIVTYRTGYVHPFGERTYHTRIALTTLTASDSAQLATAALGATSLPDDLRELIARKAEGNPFFVEEVVKSLQELGALRREGDRYELGRRLDDVIIPDTIHDVIMARIDRLADAPKKTLQLASVIGREFTRRLLDRIADLSSRTEEFLRELKALELIYEKAMFPELAYMFKHALTHDVAYGSMLVQRRQELHRTIALAVEELYADRLAEHYEVLGHHFSRAEEWSRAFEYLLKAAEKAASAFANREALALFDQAQVAADHLGAAVPLVTRKMILERKATLSSEANDFARSFAEAERLCDLCRETADAPGESAALATMAWAALWLHDFPRCSDIGEQALATGERADATQSIARAHWVLGTLATARGDRARSREHFARLVSFSRTAGNVALEAFGLGGLALLSNHEGDYADAVTRSAEGVRLSRSSGVALPRVFTLFVSGIASTGAGEYERALADFDEGLALCEKIGDEVWYHRLLNSRGWLHVETGDVIQAVDFNRRGVEGARKRGDPETKANAELNLADALVLQGDLVVAGELLEGVHHVVHDPAVSEWMKWRYSMHLFASLAELALARDDHGQARVYADQCLEVATRTNSRKYIARAWRVRGEIAIGQRHWDDADAALRDGLDIALVIRNPTQLWKMHVAIARLHAARGKVAEADAARAAARAVIAGVRDRVENAALRGQLDAMLARAIVL